MQTSKKIAKTDDIFEYVHAANRTADETDGVIRLSIDTKATIKVGPFSRGGYSRNEVKACDHDFEPKTTIKPFGIFLPKLNENYFYFTESNVTADFMIDALEDLWPTLKARFNPHTIVINSDNGPENNSLRTQFIKRLFDFANSNEVGISLIYYPPYHSKYNPIERVWAVLENHWRGQLLESVDKIIGMAKTMIYNGKHPLVKLVAGTYETGVKLTKKVMKKIEKVINRLPGIEKWAVDTPFY